jgi:hypothetical protein
MARNANGPPQRAVHRHHITAATPPPQGPTPACIVTDDVQVRPAQPCPSSGHNPVIALRQLLDDHRGTRQPGFREAWESLDEFRLKALLADGWGQGLKVAAKRSAA